MRCVRGKTSQRTANVAINLSRFRRWINGFVEAIGAPQRIEMTVQSERVLIIRRRSNRVWCRQCGRQVDAVIFEEAGALAGAAQLALPGNGESAPWHLCTDEQGVQLVCLESMLKAG
jgi:hypothetical protein